MAFGRQGVGNLHARKWARNGGIAVGVVVLLLLVLGWYWSRTPTTVNTAAVLSDYTTSKNVTGARTTAALIGVTETLLEKPGGYLSNDMLPPGLWLDNMPNWEYGALTQARDLAKAMRDRFSRSQSQSAEDPGLALAEPKLNFDNDSWMFPATESEYRDSLKHLYGYLQRLVDDDQYNAQFYVRADNLRFYLSTVDARLGSLSQRLSASVGRKRLNIDLAGDEAGEQATEAPREIEVKTPWLELDDVFYEARGSTWALIQFLTAMEKDFRPVLEKKNALVSLQQIIRELESTQEPVLSPVVLNGSGFGYLANHSLTMASYISRANAAIIDLRDLLAQG